MELVFYDAFTDWSRKKKQRASIEFETNVTFSPLLHVQAISHTVINLCWCTQHHGRPRSSCIHSFYSFPENIKWMHDRLRLPLFHAILIDIIKMLTSCLCGKYNFIYIGQVLKINIFTNTVYRVRSQVIKLSQTHKKSNLLSFRQKDKSEVSKPQSVQFPSFLGLIDTNWCAMATQSQSVLTDLPIRQFHYVLDCTTAVQITTQVLYKVQQTSSGAHGDHKSDSDG